MSQNTNSSNYQNPSNNPNLSNNHNPSNNLNSSTTLSIISNIIARRNLLINSIIDDDSDDIMGMMLLQQIQREEAESSNPPRRRRRYFNRERENGNDRLFKDYFDNPPVFPADFFRRRFRMRRELFLRIVQAVETHSFYFQQRPDARGMLGLSSIQKCTAAIRQLAYGGPADQLDEYLRMAETTAVMCLFNFCKSVIEVFGNTYLRRPNANDIQRLLQMHDEKHGFPGMIGSIDCMHWQWKNCPVAWQGQFTRGDKGVPTIMLEAVASQDLWIWHAFFGVAGSNNDINVLNQSPLFNDVLQGTAPEVTFTVNGREYQQGYYLADGIYPEWSTFVKSFAHPQDPKRILFKQKQESARKDVERAFGVLQARWAIVRGPARFWYRNNLNDIMYACIILHNMIIEDEGDEAINWFDESGEPPITPTQGPVGGFSNYLQRNADIHHKERHHELRGDLMEHIWRRFAGDNNSN